jgi:hypothetical protein
MKTGKVVVLLAAMAAGAPAFAQGPETPIEPGYWEATNRLLSPIRQTKVERRCLKPAEIAKFVQGPSNRHYTCEYPTRVVENGYLRMEGWCRPRKKPTGRRIEVAGEGSYTPTSFQITARLRTEFLGIPIHGRGSIEARRIGETCPATDADKD